MFFTGVFKIDDDSALIDHKIHDRDQYDDDLVSWFSEKGEEEPAQIERDIGSLSS